MACGYKRRCMFRLSVGWVPAMSLLAVAGISGGCSLFGGGRGAAKDLVLREHFADQTPAHVEPGALDSVVLLYDPKKPTLGSGTVIAPDRVLTAAHVVDDMTRDERGRLLVEIDGEPLTAVVEAAGDLDQPHGDWAVLALDRARWSQVAIVHEPARDIRWVPPTGTEILLVGYASGFFPDKMINVDTPTPCVVAKIVNTAPEHAAWFAEGDLVDLKGMSGGAAMLWNRERNRAELIGLFRGYVRTETVTTRETEIAGVITTTRETVEPGIAFTIHRLPELVRNPRPNTR